MDTGTNQPESQNDANEPNQPNQSNPSGPSGPGGNRFNRRRRRKGRKGAPAGQQNARPQNGAQGQGQGQSNNRSRGQFDHRKNQQQNRRGGASAGPRGRRGPGRGATPFVGPMDHSYRNANGNMNGAMGNGRYRSPGAPHSHNVEPDFAPVAEDSRKIICFVEDLFFLAKIQEVARKLGAKVEFAKADKETIDRIVSEEEKPALIIFDLNNVNAKPLTTIPKLKNKLKKGTSIVGFLSHIQGDLKLKAQEAGCDMVVPRSAFSQNLPGLLRRHSGGEQLASSEGM